MRLMERFAGGDMETAVKVVMSTPWGLQMATSQRANFRERFLYGE